MRERIAAVILVAVLLVTGSSPARGQAPPGPKIYVGLFKEDAIAVVDAAERRVVGRIPVPRGPHGLVVTRDGRKVYVSSDGASTVSVIDTVTDRVVGSVEVGQNPHGLAVSADGRQVLVSAWGANEAIVIDTATDRITARVGVARAHNGAFTPDGRTAYVGSQLSGATAIVVLDLAGGAERARVPLDRTPRALDVSPDGRWLYFTVAGDDAVQVLETATNRIVGRIAVGASPHHAPFTADGRRALVPSQGPGELAVVDVAGQRVSGVVAVGKTPHWVTSSPDGKVAYVTNEGSGDVTVVDVEARTVLATIAVGQAPRKIAVQPVAARAARAPAPAAGRAEAAGPAPAAGPATVDIAVDDYAFTPAAVTVRPGTPIRLRLANRSTTLHNITLPAQRIDRDIDPGSTVEVDVTAPAAGRLAFACKFHGPLGQRGELIVARQEIGPKEASGGRLLRDRPQEPMDARGSSSSTTDRAPEGGPSHAHRSGSPALKMLWRG